MEEPGVHYHPREVLVTVQNVRRTLLVVGAMLAGVFMVETAGAVRIDPKVKACLQRTVGQKATRAIERAPKLTSAQARAVAACKKSSGSTTTTTVPAGSVSTFDLDPELSASDAAKVRTWTAEVVAKHRELFGVSVEKFTTNVSRSASWLANRDCQRHSGWVTCVHDRTNLFGSTWAFAGCTPAPVAIECYQVANLANFTGDENQHYKVFAHEVHHIVQDQLHRDFVASRAPSNTVRPIGPDWLIEGAAEFVGYYIASEAGRTTMASARSEWAGIASGISRNLSTFETVDGRLPNGYHLYAVAVDELLKREGNSIRKLATYYQLLATGIGWQSAFQQAFGLTPTAFYSHFESVRPR